MNPYIAAALGGFLATIPMTGTMILMRKALPRRKRELLPPRVIFRRAAGRLGLPAGPPEFSAPTVAAHMGYGAAAGALYGAAVTRRDSRDPITWGSLFGLGVWAGSYLGLIPAMGLMAPASRQPARRNAIMISSHLVWGVTTAALSNALSRRAPLSGARS